MLTVEQQIEAVENELIASPDEIDQQHAMAETFERFVEVWGHHTVTDPLTGEIINIFDPAIPVHQKADAVQWVLEKLDNEQEMCDERKRLWKEKGQKLQKVIKQIRETVLFQMQQEGVRKVKTPENTFSIGTRTSVEYDYSKIPLENRKVRVTDVHEVSMREALEMGFNIEQMEFIGVMHPEDVPEDAVKKEVTEHIVIRTRK